VVIGIVYLGTVLGAVNQSTFFYDHLLVLTRKPGVNTLYMWMYKRN